MNFIELFNFTKYFKTVGDGFDAKIGHVNALAEETLPKYVEYRALLNQTGTDAPTVNILNNTLGEVPTFAYYGEGQYGLITNGLFDDYTKVEIYIPNINIQTTSMSTNVFRIFSATWVDANTIFIKSGQILNELTINALTIGGANNTDVYADNMLFATPIVIRIWN